MTMQKNPAHFLDLLNSYGTRNQLPVLEPPPNPRLVGPIGNQQAQKLPDVFQLQIEHLARPYISIGCGNVLIIRRSRVQVPYSPLSCSSSLA